MIEGERLLVELPGVERWLIRLTCALVLANLAGQLWVGCLR
jgi:hypothetical protein